MELFLSVLFIRLAPDMHGRAIKPDMSSIRSAIMAQEGVALAPIDYQPAQRRSGLRPMPKVGH